MKKYQHTATGHIVDVPAGVTLGKGWTPLDGTSGEAIRAAAIDPAAKKQQLAATKRQERIAKGLKLADNARDTFEGNASLYYQKKGNKNMAVRVEGACIFVEHPKIETNSKGKKKTPGSITLLEVAQTLAGAALLVLNSVLEAEDAK